MGAAPTTTGSTTEAIDIRGCLQYEVDLRMVEYSILLPTSFASNIHKVIQEIETLHEGIAPHPLEKYIASNLDTRFSRYNCVDTQAFSSQKSFMEVVRVEAERFETDQWFELGSKESFLALLTSLQRHYEIEKKIKCEYDREEGILQKGRERKLGGQFETLRKSTLTRQSLPSQIDVQLLMRLYFEYYLRILKNNANSDEKQRVLEFHSKTGRMLCLLMVHNYLPMEELFELAYLIVYIDKHGVRAAGKMDSIHRKYYPLALQQYYSIGTTQHKLQVRQAAARLYLDELYLNSLREAQDPDIKPSDDCLLPIKVFPISRVKDKPKI